MGSYEKTGFTCPPRASPRIAVIGAGLSGLVTAKHLLSSGLDVVVFERSNAVGGNWVYDPRGPPEPTFPSMLPSRADCACLSPAPTARKGNGRAGDGGDEVGGEGGCGGKEGGERGERRDKAERGERGEWRERKESERARGKERHESEEWQWRHAPPGPAYAGLTTNVPTYLQELKDFPWSKTLPEGADAFVNVRECGRYLQGYAGVFGVDGVVRFGCRVERISKVQAGRWAVEWSCVRDGKEGFGVEVEVQVEEFDCVVIANGHYHASKVPDIAGLKEWKERRGDRVQHSKSYRTPEGFRDQNVLLIGAGVSSTDIAREISHVAKNIYQSSRSSPYDLPVEMLPSTASRIAEVASFDAEGVVTLKGGKILSGIDRVVICTGYHFSLPFLQDLHKDLLPLDQADEKVLVTNGTQLHNLHKDLFYIPDPTLAFVGVPFYTATFRFFEYQAIAVAAVLSGRAWLPTAEEMRREYGERVKRKGLGRALHDMKVEEAEYVKEIVDWVNEHAEVTGGAKVEGHSKEWLKKKEVMREEFLRFLVEKEKRERERALLEANGNTH